VALVGRRPQRIAKEEVVMRFWEYALLWVSLFILFEYLYGRHVREFLRRLKKEAPKDWEV